MKNEEGSQNNISNRTFIPRKFEIVHSIENSLVDSVNSLCLLGDKRLAVCTESRVISIFNLETYEADVLIKDSHEEAVLSICEMKNGNIVSSSSDKTIKIWEIIGKEYKLVSVLEGHSSSVTSVIQLQDGRICSCSEDSTVRIWDVFGNVKVLKGHIYGVCSVLEIEDHIVTTSEDDTMRVWNKSYLQCEAVLVDIYCYSSKGLCKLKNDTLILGGFKFLSIISVALLQPKVIKCKTLGNITCLSILEDATVLIGNEHGVLLCFSPVTSQVVFKKNLYNNQISCLTGNKKESLIVLSHNDSVDIYNMTFNN